jgi:hypothetical protein
MNPLERVRIEKAAADCGFEMPLAELDGTLQLRSARFPEVVTVRTLASEVFEIGASNHALLRDATTLHGYASLYDTLRTLAAHARTLPNRVTGTTIDDRLRVLVQQGRVKRCGHGLYLPHIPIPTTTIPARPRRVIPAEPPGTRTATQDDAGNPVLIRWLKPGEAPW